MLKPLRNNHERAARRGDLFAEALRLPPEQRAAYLDRSTHGDAALRQRVAALLKSYEEGVFLERAASPLDETITAPVPTTSAALK